MSTNTDKTTKTASVQPENVRTYAACFTGRQIGAIGKFHAVKTHVEARNEDEARLSLYDRFEHITNLKLTILGHTAFETQPQAQHSPLPWRCDFATVRPEGGGEIIADCYNDEREHGIPNAELIVASVNNAEALAEALRDCMADLDHYVSTHGPGPDQRRDKARAALARWEAK